MSLFRKLFGKFKNDTSGTNKNSTKKLTQKKNRQKDHLAARIVDIENDRWWLLPHGKIKLGPFPLEELRGAYLNENNVDKLSIRKDGDPDWVKWVNAKTVFPSLGYYFDEIKKYRISLEQKKDDEDIGKKQTSSNYQASVDKKGNVIPSKVTHIVFFPLGLSKPMSWDKLSLAGANVYEMVNPAFCATIKHRFHKDIPIIGITGKDFLISESPLVVPQIVKENVGKIAEDASMIIQDGTTSSALGSLQFVLVTIVAGGDHTVFSKKTIKPLKK